MSLLLDRYDEIGLNLTERENCFWENVFTAACRCTQPEILCILLDFAHKRRIDVNVLLDWDGNDIFQCGFYIGNEKIIKSLLKRADQHNFDLNHKNFAGETTFLTACNDTWPNKVPKSNMANWPCLRKVELLLDFAKKRKIKLQIDGFQNLNRSILQVKISDSLNYPKDVEIVKMLISRRKEIGLDLNHKDDNGMTAYDLLVHDDFPFEDAIRRKVLELLENEYRKQCIIL